MHKQEKGFSRILKLKCSRLDLCISILSKIYKESKSKKKNDIFAENFKNRKQDLFS